MFVITACRIDTLDRLQKLLACIASVERFTELSHFISVNQSELLPLLPTTSVRCKIYKHKFNMSQFNHLEFLINKLCGFSDPSVPVMVLDDDDMLLRIPELQDGFCRGVQYAGTDVNWSNVLETVPFFKVQTDLSGYTTPLAIWKKYFQDYSKFYYDSLQDEHFRSWVDKLILKTGYTMEPFIYKRPSSAIWIQELFWDADMLYNRSKVLRDIMCCKKY
jgi:hypothetical protein